jgi:hypothetical protein
LKYIVASLLSNRLSAISYRSVLLRAELPELPGN